MVFPTTFGELNWDDLEYLGWRDPKAQQRGYLALWREDALTGLALRAPDGASRKSVMCTLCHSTHSGGGVALFVARRGGAAGRNENTIGTYICADLNCSRYARLSAATASIFPEPGIEVEERLIRLRRRSTAFVNRVLA